MSFDQDPNESVTLSGADFQMLVDERNAFERQIVELLVTLKDIVDCISETRGKDAAEALASAHALLDRQTAAAQPTDPLQALVDQEGGAA